MWVGLNRYLARLRGLGRNAKLYLLAVLLAGLASSINGLFFNLYVDSRGLSREFLGTLRALSPLLNLLLALPAGVLSDRIGRKRALLISRVGAVASLALFTLALSPPLMLVLHLLRGGFSVLYVVTEAAFMVENSTSRERTALFSASYGLATLVGFIGYLVGGYLPDLFRQAFGLALPAQAYQATLWTVAGLELIGLIPLFVLSPAPSVQGERPRLNLRRLWGQLSFMLRFLLTIFIGFGGAALIIPYLNLFFQDRFGFPPSTLGWIFAISQGITGLMVTLAPLLADRWGRIRSMTATGLTSIPLLLMIGFVPIPGIAVGAFWLRAGLMRIGNPLYDSFYLERFPKEERATASSLQRMVFNLGWAAGSWLSGQFQKNSADWTLLRWFGDRFLSSEGWQIQYGPAYALLFLLTALLYLIFLVLVYLFFAREEKLAHADS